MDAADQVYAQALAELGLAEGRADRRRIVKRVAARLGVSNSTVYRQLKRRGWDSGRGGGQRGERSAVSGEVLDQLARMMAAGRNKRGQANLPTSEAVRVAQEQGLLPPELSYAQVCRRLRQEGLSMRHMRAPRPSISRVSTHPNHVWFIDVSVAIQWYFRDEQGRRKLALYMDGDRRFYEGKRDNLLGRDKILLRYLVVDHFSGAYYVRYYYARGENAVDVVDFLHHAIAAKFNPEAYPFRGIPRRIVVDQGPAFKAALTQTLLGELGVECELHAPGNAKASGMVESRHGHWQKSYEGRLALKPAEDIEGINATAERFCALANAERPHSRHGHSPMALWSTITPAQLIEAPERQVFLQLAATKRRTATLDNRLWLRADGRRWYISGDNVFPRQKVEFRLAPFSDTGIRVWDSEGRELAALELEFDLAGFPTNGPRHVWDDEAAPGASIRPAPAQALSDEVVADPSATRVEDIFDDLDERLAQHAYLAAQRGTEWTPTDSPLSGEPQISSVEAREEIAARLGRALSRDEGRWWRERLGTGCTRAELEAAWTDFTTGAEAPITTAAQRG